MRKIEKRILAELARQASVKSENRKEFSITLSKRDRVYTNAYGNIRYVLWGNIVFTVYVDKYGLGVYGGNYQTATTKSRINAISRAFGLPGITQKNFVWTWSDGVAYDGIRVFPR